MTQATTPDGAALQAADRPHAITQLTLENGIVLRIKPVPPFMLRSASAHLKQPVVPMWTNPDKGTQEPNPNDPDYLQARMQWALDVSEAGITVALVLGTEVISLPDGIYSVDADEWIDELIASYELVNAPVTIRRDGRGRYLDWLRMYAIPTNTDLFRLSKILTSGIALTEDEVDAAARSFRSAASGTADYGLPAADLGPIVGDNDPADASRDAG